MKDHYEISHCLNDLDNQRLVQVGLALGMNYAKLKRMRSLPGDMVAAWLRREDDVLQVSGIPTWKALSEALKDVGQTGLSMKIQQKHQQGIHTYRERDRGVRIVASTEGREGRTGKGRVRAMRGKEGW